MADSDEFNKTVF